MDAKIEFYLHDRKGDRGDDRLWPVHGPFTVHNFPLHGAAFGQIDGVYGSKGEHEAVVASFSGLPEDKLERERIIAATLDLLQMRCNNLEG